MNSNPAEQNLCSSVVGILHIKGVADPKVGESSIEQSITSLEVQVQLWRLNSGLHCAHWLWAMLHWQAQLSILLLVLLLVLLAGWQVRQLSQGREFWTTLDPQARMLQVLNPVLSLPVLVLIALTVSSCQSVTFVMKLNE